MCTGGNGMSAVAMISAEPTHRYGRALDDRLPATGEAPWMRAAQAGGTPGPLQTASVETVSPGGTGLDFGDLLDAVNPLQHLPVIGPLYREWTGDEIGPVARVVGGGLFGGLVGALASLVDVAVEELTGDDMGGHVMTALFGAPDDAPASQQVAAGPETRRAEIPVREAAAARARAPQLAARTGARAHVSAENPEAPAGNQARTASSLGHSRALAGGAGSGLPVLSPAAFEALVSSFQQQGADDAANGGGDGRSPMAERVPAAEGVPVAARVPLAADLAAGAGRRLDIAL